MMPNSTTLWRIGALVAIAGAGYWMYANVYAGPRDTLIDELKMYRGAIKEDTARLKASKATQAALAERAASTLGKTPDLIDHRFRSHLHAIATACGLDEVVISAGRLSGVRNPASREVRRGEFQRMLAEGADYAVVQGEVNGEGTLDQVLRTLATLDHQQWISRVDRFSLKPVSEDRKRFELRASVITPVLPDLASDDPDPGWTPLEEGAAVQWASIIDRNVFRMPDPEPEPVVVVEQPEPEPQQPPAPPPPPYHTWRVTGVLEGVGGVEVMLVNTESGKRRTLSPGQAILDATLIEASGEQAVFEIESTKFIVTMGNTLAERGEFKPEKRAATERPTHAHDGVHDAAADHTHVSHSRNYPGGGRYYARAGAA